MNTRFALAGLLMLVLVTLAPADTWVPPGNVSGIWTAANSPYIIQGDIHVLAGEALNIGPGVRVEFDGLYRLEVDSLGDFSANGAEGDSVVFTIDTVAHPFRWCGILIHCPTDTVRMSYCVIEDMRRDSTRMEGDTIADQAALQVMDGPGLNLSHSGLRNNQGSGMGGALRVWADNAVITDCQFVGNLGRYGGGANLGCNARVENCLFEGNFSGGGGGAIHICFGSNESRISYCIFRSNVCGTLHPDGGGAIRQHEGLLYLTDCTFFNDSCLWGGDGGAINSGPVGGGEETVTLHALHCLFTHNYAWQSGGAIAAANGTITNCTVAQNYSSVGGTAVSSHLSAIATDTLDISNTIAAYSYGQYGSGMNLIRGSRVRHCLVYGSAHAIYVMLDNQVGHITQTNANGDSCDAYQNLFLNPMFVDTANGDYHLTANSPCIDAGDPAEPNDPDGTVSDIGAFYYPQPSSVARPLPFIVHPSSLIVSPNPFNATTRISFLLPQAAEVSLCVYDITGRLTAMLMSGKVGAGTHEIAFDGKSLASGIYFVRLKAGATSQTQKLVLMK